MADQKNPPDIRSVFADPEFRQLPASEKINALGHLYPDFQELPLNEKTSAIQTALQKIPMAARQPPGFWGTIGGVASGMAEAARERFQHPLQSPAPGMLAAGLEQAEQFFKAGREFKAGQPIRGAGYVGAGLVPLSGPAAAQAGEEFQRGETGAAWAHTLMLLGPDVVSAGLGLTESMGGAATRRALRNRLTPVQQARLAEAETRAAQAGFKGPLTTRGEAAGVPWVRKVERTMQHTPGAAGRAEDFYTARGGELERQARESVEAVAPTMAPGSTPVDVATDVYHEGEATIRKTKRAADKIYDDVRARAAQDTQNIRIGTRVKVDAQGNKTYHPIIGTYESPVPLKQLRARLMPLYNEFRTVFKDLDESQKMANPGYASLHRIMTDTDPLTPGRLRQYMGAMDLESELRSIKQQLRDRRFSNFLFSPSGRVQLRIINEGEAAVGKALDKAQPGTYTLLQQGRQLVRSYKNADKLLTQLVGKDPDKLNPMGLFEAMTPAADKKLYAVTRLAQMAPNTSKAVARMYLEGLIENATKNAGRLEEGVGGGLVSGFDRLGPKTKQVWFGPQLTQELNNVFHNIKDLMPKEGSPTAFRAPAMMLAGAALEAFQSLFMGHPMAAAATVAETAAAMTGANIMARVLFSRGGGATVSRLLRAGKIGGAALREATRAFEARVAVAQQEQREEQERQAAPAETPARPAETPAPAPAAAEAAPPTETPAATPTVSRAAATIGGWPTSSAPSRVAPTSRTGTRPQPGVVQAAAPTRSPTGRTAARTRPDFSAAYRQVGQTAGVPPGLLHTIAQLESSGNPDAVGGSGERGLMQLMPATARALGVDPTDPQQSIRGAAQLVRRLMTKYKGEIWKVLAAYNEGETAFDRHQQRGEPLPAITQRYVRNGLALLRGGGRAQVAAR